MNPIQRPEPVAAVPTVQPAGTGPVAAETSVAAMESAETYKAQLALFVASTNEKQLEIEWITWEATGLPQRRAFLDVGAGGGDLTGPISHLFERTTVVEPNAEQTRRLRDRFPRFTVLESTLDRADLGSEPFDLILCSHVLYYVPQSEWPGHVRKMHRHLAPDGKLIIVLQSPIGQVSDFFRHFADYDVDLLGLWNDLVATFGEQHVAIRYLRPTIHTASLDEMVEIGLFLLLAPGFQSRRVEIRDYLEAHHRSEGGYTLTQDQVVLTVTKPAEPARAAARVAVQEIDDVVIVQVEGRFDFHTSPAIEQTLLEQVRAGKGKLVLDFSRTDFLSSAGLRVLLTVARKAQESHGELKLASPQEAVAEVLKLTNFLELFEVYPSSLAAVNGFRGGRGAGD
jgi:anti-anti-sigma factor